jgi:hypothetical protein
MLYVEINAQGVIHHPQYAPYLDYRPLKDDEPRPEAILALPQCQWINHELERVAQDHAIKNVVPQHVSEVRERRLSWIERTKIAVKERLTREIAYWDHRSSQLQTQEQAGRSNAQLNSNEARKRADELQGRLQRRLKELEQEAIISALPPVIMGGVVVIPVGLLNSIAGIPPLTRPLETQASAARARSIIMEAERQLGFTPKDLEHLKLGYDIESCDPKTGKLRFLEVKGRVSNAETITVTKNEILYSLNKPKDFILAIVAFEQDESHSVHYIRSPFQNRPDFAVTSINYSLPDLISRSSPPS